MPKLPDIILPTSLKERLAQGHPWVYRNHVPLGIRLPSGAWVRARCGNWSGYGLWDNSSPIAIRIFSERQVPDARWLRERVADAWALRAPLREAGCTAFRWLFGEGDGLPGITVDHYDDFAVIQAYMDGADTLLTWLPDALQAVAPLRGVLLRESQQPTNDERRMTNDERQQEDKETRRQGDKEIAAHPLTRSPAHSLTRPSSIVSLSGRLPPDDLIVAEHGLLFHANLHVGQKTGLFLDQRENRRFVESISAGRTVLNCFAYTGAFSLYALRGGAQHVKSNDIGKGLAEATDANILLNGLDAERHSFVTEDSFALLQRYVEQGHHFDLVILDPPSFAKNKQSRFAAQRAYARLNALAMRCVAPGGLLATASCTSQIGPEAFKDMLAAACALAGRRMQIIHEAGQPRDHPVPVSFPEGRYLKFVVGRVDEIV